MGAISTISGHVARALDFYAKSNYWFGIGRSTDWQYAILTSRVRGTTFDTSVGSGYNVLALTVDSVDYAVTLPDSVAATILNVLSAINTAVGSSVAANDGTNRVKITSAVAGITGNVSIRANNAGLGFLEDEVATGRNSDSNPAIEDPTRREIEEPIGFKKYSTMELIIPETETFAMLEGTVSALNFNTSTASGDNSLSFDVDGDTVVVTFTDTLSNFIDDVVDEINLAAAAVNLKYGSVATRTADNTIKLTSPTVGTSGSVVIDAVDGNSILGFATGATDTGVDPDIIYGPPVGGVETYWRIILEAAAYDEGARWVYISADLNYDESGDLPVDPDPLSIFRQYGLIDGVLPATPEVVLTPSEVTTFGELTVLRNISPIGRNTYHRERLSFIMEF